MTPDKLESLLDALSSTGFTLPQLRTLLALRKGRLSMTELSKKLKHTTAAATGSVDIMEKRGLVARSHSSDDRRLIHASLTITGITKVDTIMLSVSNHQNQ